MGFEYSSLRLWYDALMGDESRKAIAKNFLQNEANRKDYADASQARIAVTALEIAKKKHTSCRGILGQLPISGNGFDFECCDCHKVVGVSAMEASL